VGVIGDTLVSAGGTAWDRPPWDGGTKTWTDAVLTLRRGAKAWREAGRLPRGLGYGASVNVPGGMVLFGGQTATDLSREVLLLSITNGRGRIRRLADLPRPLAMMSGAAGGGMVYLAGGQPTFSPSAALALFLAIPLDELLAGKPAWKELPVWDGPPRFFAHLAACGSSAYLAGGADLVPGPEGTPVRQFLADAHVYTAAAGWMPLPNMPRKAQAGLAACLGGRFYVFGGSDGTLSESLREKHPGFRLDVLEYDPAARAWREAGRVPTSLVTTGIAKWGNEYVIAGGEDRPGHRSAKVVAATIGGTK
jgi:N-acetylneuraminic acid mutarotase